MRIRNTAFYLVLRNPGRTMLKFLSRYSKNEISGRIRNRRAKQCRFFRAPTVHFLYYALNCSIQRVLSAELRNCCGAHCYA
jgi:hypothetical protein